MAQIISITSEALQATIRRLLPSQQGFGEDLQATNVVTPIIDLTPSAEGSEVRQDLQTALALNSVTEFVARNATSIFANTPGFYRVFGTMHAQADGGAVSSGKIIQTDNPGGGSTSKTLFVSQTASATATVGVIQTTQQFDFTVFLQQGEDLQAISSGTDCFVDGVVRQIADVNGNLVNPVGFTPQ